MKSIRKNLRPRTCLIIWQAPWAGKMNQIARCDWPSLQLFGQDGWKLASFFLCEFMDLDFVSVHKPALKCIWHKKFFLLNWKAFLKLINYSCSSYVFETISNTDANFLNLRIDKATKTRGDKQLYLITHFTKQTLNLNYLLLTLTVTEQFLKNPKQKRTFFF